MEDKIIVQLAQPEREFVKVYKDFLNCKLLTAEEKLIYIALKSFVTYGRDSDEVYPSMETLCSITSMSKPRATRTITSLVKKGIIKKQRRGLTKANLYTIVDVPAMWGTDTLEELKTVSESQMSDKTNEELIEELIKRGAITIVKEKELESEPTKAQTQALLNNQSLNLYNYITKDQDCQAVERYTMEQIKEYFYYDIMVHDNPYKQKSIDMVMNILYDALNTTKQTIRVSGEDKPAMVVQSKLMKLDSSCIMYAIEKFAENTERVKNPISYMLTILYKSQEQYDLDIQNQVSHDMANWSFKVDE